VEITARTDYAVRAMAELAARPGAHATRRDLAEAQDIPAKFLEGILADLRRAGLVQAQRGSAGGYTLARSADGIAVADIVRAVDGPLAGVHGIAPESLAYAGPATALREVWVALRASMRHVLEATTVADIVAGSLPEEVRARLADDGAWRRR